MKKSLVALAVAALISTPALAAEGQAYIFGDYGSAKFQNSGLLPSPGMLDFGAGYQFHPNIAGELGYTIFGDSKVDFGGGDTATFKSSATHAAVVGIFPISNELSVFGKLGFSSNKGDISVTGAVTTTKPSVSKTDTYFGLGVRYNFDKQVSMHVQYQNFGKFESATNPLSATGISVGASYNF
jgi:OOP family OmpA-OmpF porin